MLKDGAKDHRKTFLNWKRCPIESIEAKLEFGENVPHSIVSEVPMYIERACVASVAYSSNPRSEYTLCIYIVSRQFLQSRVKRAEN